MSADATLKPAPAWGRSAGHTQVKKLAAEPSDAAIDRLLIAERIHRYGWGYDERDREALGDCFTADGVWEALIMGTDPVGPFEGRDAIVDWLMGFWDVQTDQRRHVFTNVVIDDLTDSTATAHAYVVLLASADSTMVPQTAGPYRLSMVKDDDGVWRMSRLVAGFDAPF